MACQQPLGGEKGVAGLVGEVNNEVSTEAVS